MIEFEGVTHNYMDGTRSLDDFSATFREGETTALFGDNGAGKSTLALLASGILKPDSGCVRVDGMDTRDRGSIWEIRKRVGLVFQNPETQFVATTVEREIAFGLENLGIETDEMRERVESTLRVFEIAQLRDRSPRDLSLGEKALVALASVMVLGPKYLMLDEPTSHLDGREARRLFDVLNEVESRPTVVLISQEREEVARCERAIVLESGRKVFEGGTSEFLRKAFPDAELIELARELRESGIPVAERPADLMEFIDSIALLRGQKPAEKADLRVPVQESSVRDSWLESLSLLNASYTYRKGLPGEKAGLKDADAAVRLGETLGVQGPNGSGKTTLSLLLSGLLKPDSGRFEARARNGRSFHDSRTLRREIGFVFQNPERAFFSETCLDEVLYGVRNFGVERPVETALSVLDFAGLDSGAFRGRSPFGISYGEQRRLAIACALAYNPPVVFFDEPTAGLDQKGRGLVRRILRKTRSSGRTAVVVSHEPGLVLDSSDRLILLDGGRVVRSCSAREFREDAVFETLWPGKSCLREVLVGLRARGLDVDTGALSPRLAARSILAALEV